MEWASSWVDVTAFAQVVQVLDFVSGNESRKKIKNKISVMQLMHFDDEIQL